jgi:hypothetical protein
MTHSQKIQEIYSKFVKIHIYIFMVTAALFDFKIADTYNINFIYWNVMKILVQVVHAPKNFCFASTLYNRYEYMCGVGKKCPCLLDLDTMYSQLSQLRSIITFNHGSTSSVEWQVAFIVDCYCYSYFLFKKKRLLRLSDLNCESWLYIVFINNNYF